MSDAPTTNVVAKPQPQISPGAEPFWEHARQEELYLPFCEDCQQPFYYPRRWCPACFSQNLSWRKMSGKGRVYSFSVIHQSPLPAYQQDVPYILAIVELDEGPRMMTNILDCEISAVNVDMAVEVIFEVRGAMKIPQFRPCK